MWPSGAEDKVAGDRGREEFQPAGPRCQPACGMPGSGKPAAKPCSPRERARQQRWRLGSVPRLAGQKGCAGTREGVCWKVSTGSYSSLAGDGQRRCVPSQGSACIHVPRAGTLCAPLQCFSDSGWPLGVLRPMVERGSCSR